MTWLTRVGLLPVSLLGLSLWHGRNEAGMWGLSAVTIGAFVIALGPVFLLLSRWLVVLRRTHVGPTVPTPTPLPPIATTTSSPSVETSVETPVVLGF